jgi:hypothetical protein
MLEPIALLLMVAGGDVTGWKPSATTQWENTTHDLVQSDREK